MKIEKRKYAKTSETLPIFSIPTFTYLIEKVSGIIDPTLEWIWWLAILITFTAWFFINFKIK